MQKSIDSPRGAQAAEAPVEGSNRDQAIVIGSSDEEGKGEEKGKGKYDGSLDDAMTDAERYEVRRALIDIAESSSPLTLIISCRAIDVSTLRPHHGATS